MNGPASSTTSPTATIVNISTSAMAAPTNITTPTTSSNKNNGNSNNNMLSLLSSWEDQFDRLLEYQKEHDGNWVVNPRLAHDDDTRLLYESLAMWVSYQQCHMSSMTDEQRHKWLALTGTGRTGSSPTNGNTNNNDRPRRERKPSVKRKSPSPEQSPSQSHQSPLHSPPAKKKTKSSSNASPSPGAAPGSFHAEYQNAKPSNSASLYTRYRSKGVGLSQMQWNSMFDKLLAYQKVHGHVNVPVRFKTDPKLGKWVSRQRESRTSMTEERRNRLNAIGFSWTQKRPCHVISPQWQDGTNRNRRTYDKLWNARYQQLQLFHQTFGHTLVETASANDLATLVVLSKNQDPSQEPTPPDDMDKFRRWVSKQRALGGRGELRADRDKMLDQLGFWKDRQLNEQRAALTGIHPKQPPSGTSVTNVNLTSTTITKTSSHLSEEDEEDDEEEEEEEDEDGNEEDQGHADVPQHHHQPEQDVAMTSPNVTMSSTSASSRVPDLSKYSTPISQEAVDQAVRLYKQEAAKEAKEHKKKLMDRGPPAVGNRLPPLQVPAHVRRQETMQYFQHRKQQQMESSSSPKQQQQSMVRQLIQHEWDLQDEQQQQQQQQQVEEYGRYACLDDEDDDDDYDVRAFPSYNEDDDNEDDEDVEDEKARAISSSAAEQALREAIEASELSQRRREEAQQQQQQTTATTSPARHDQDGTVVAALKAVPPASATTSIATPAPLLHSTMVTPSPTAASGAATAAAVMPPPPTTTTLLHHGRPVYPKTMAPTPKLEYYRVNQEVRSFEDACLKMLDNKSADWKRKRRWTYVCM